MICDRSEAEKHIALLTGSSDTVIDWATIPDRKDAPAKRPALRFRGTLAECWDRLVEENRSGSGVFLTINATDGNGFKKENVIACRAVFCDDDSGTKSADDFAAAGLRPSFVCQSFAGLHAYWTLVPGEDINDFTPCQKKLAAKFGTDPAVHDLPRVLRCAGFWHQKDLTEPFQVFIEEGGGYQSFTFAEIAAAFKLLEEKPAARRPPRRAPPAAAVYSPPAETGVTTALAVIPATSAEFFERARARKAEPAASGKSIFAAASDVRRGNLSARAKLAASYLEKVPPAVQGQRGDEQTLKACMVAVRDFALPEETAFEVLTPWNGRCVPPWDADGLRTKIRNAFNHGSGEIGAKCAPLVKPAHVSPDGAVVPAAEVEIGSADDLLEFKPVDASGKEIQSIRPPETRAAVIRRQLSDPKTLAVLLGVDSPDGNGPGAKELAGALDLQLALDIRGDDVVLRGKRSVWKPGEKETGEKETGEKQPGETEEVRVVITHVDHEVTNILTRVGNVRENQLGHDKESDGEDSGPKKLYVKDWNATELRAQLMAVAFGNSYDSVLGFLASLPSWDGVDRFSDLLESLKCDAPVELYSQYLRKTMLSAIARVFDPGCKVDTMLILQGQKGGERKSSFFRTLVGDPFFSDAKIDVSSKDTFTSVNHFWVHEWSEMDALRRASSREEMKAFIVRQVEYFRPVYGHAHTKVPRRSIFVGSTNPKEILENDGGNRRFWIIQDVGARGGIDIRAAGRMREQLWAQSLAAYAAYVGARSDRASWDALTNSQQADLGWWLNEEHETKHEDMVIDFVQENIGAELIRKFIDTKQTITISEILTMGPEALRNANPNDRRAQMNVANILKDAGWVKDRHMENGERKSFWRRTDKAAPYKGGPGIGGKSNVFALVSGATVTK